MRMMRRRPCYRTPSTLSKKCRRLRTEEIRLEAPLVATMRLAKWTRALSRICGTSTWPTRPSVTWSWRSKVVVLAQKCGLRVSTSLIVVVNRSRTSRSSTRASQCHLQLRSHLAVPLPLLHQLDQVNLEGRHFQLPPSHFHTHNSSNRRYLRPRRLRL